jgi:hypothetical protein
MNLSPETEQGAEEFKDEVVRSVSPEGIQNRPALALSNALMAVPGGAGVKGASMGGRFGKAMQFAKKARNIIDPAELPFTVTRGAGRQVSNVTKGALGFAKRLKDFGVTEATGFAKRLKQGDNGLLMSTLEATLGFTTGNGPRFIREMFRTGTDEPLAVRDLTGRADPGTGISTQREFRSMNQADAERIIVERGLQAVDNVKTQMNEAYTTALGELPMDAPIEVDLALRREAQKALREMNVAVEGAERLQVDEVPLDVIDSQRGSTPSGVFPGGQKETRQRVSTGEATLRFPDFGDEPGKTTTISSVGSGRGLVEDAFLRLINAPEAVSMEDLMNFRRSIDDALNAASSDASGEARVALGKMRGIVADRLNEIPGYAETMRDYEEASSALFTFDAELGLRPGNLRDGAIRNTKVSDVVGKMFGTLVAPRETAFGALGDLEKRGGDASITPAMVGAGSSPLFGSGLVVKSEISQSFRALAAFAVGKGVGALTGLPAGLIFSPRGVNEAALTLIERGIPELAVARGEQAMGKARGARDSAAGLITAARKANDSTGGTLAKQAIKEGWTLGQLFERLQINTGTEVEDGDFRPRDRLNLEAIGKIDTGQPSPSR